MTKRKLTKHEDDVRRNLRKSAEINPAQSPHNGIHTCSKGCKKQGCNRTLRETIEEQDIQIEALKRDLLEKTAAVRSQFANSEQENARLNNYIERLEVRNAELVPENARLQAEVESVRQVAQELRASSFVTAVSVEQYERVVKAGDALAVVIAYELRIDEGEELPICVQAWNAAKEGKQP